MTDNDREPEDFEALKSLNKVTAGRILALPDEARSIATGDHVVTFENPSTDERWYVGLSQDARLMKYHDTSKQVHPIEIDTLETYVKQDTSQIEGFSHVRDAPASLREAMKTGETDLDLGGSS